MHFFVRHHRAEPVHRNAEACALAANPKVAARGNLKPAANARAFYQGDHRMRAVADGREPRVHDFSIGARRRNIVALGLECRDVRTRGKGLARSAQHDAAKRKIGGQGRERVAQLFPHLKGKRVKPPRIFDDDGRDRAVLAEMHASRHHPRPASRRRL
jgi:hypothetical protein